jgi:nitrogen fixation protein FixH
MSPGLRWILIVIGLLVGNVVAVVVLITAAGPATADRVMPDYYERAAHFDDVIADADASARLGWRIETTLAGDTLTVRVRDAAGAPVSRARVGVTGYPRAHAAATIALPLLERDAAGEPGVYRVAIGAPRRGWWDLTVRADRGVEGYVARVAVEAP